jgi:hypothetical protein
MKIMMRLIGKQEDGHPTLALEDVVPKKRGRLCARMKPKRSMIRKRRLRRV